MRTNQLVRLHAVPHPSAPVRQPGFPLNHLYIQQCWAALIGPTSAPMLRRLPVLWRDDLSVEVPLEELAGSLGLGRSSGRNGRLQRTLDRLVRFRFAAVAGPAYQAVAPRHRRVPARQCDRLPAWCQSRHGQLHGDHLDGLAQLHTVPASPTSLSARLERLSRPSPTARPLPSLHR